MDTANALGIASVLWTPREKVVFTDSIEAARLRDEEFGGEWEIRESRWWEPADAPSATGGGRYASDWPDDAIAELRFSLTMREIERVRALGRDTIEILERLLKNDVKPGMTEHRIGGAVAGGLRRHFRPVVLVASDERIAKYRHPIPTAKTGRADRDGRGVRAASWVDRQRPHGFVSFVAAVRRASSPPRRRMPHRPAPA